MLTKLAHCADTKVATVKPTCQNISGTYVFKFADALMDDPSAGDVIQGTGGLRKLRWMDKRRGKGKRGGMRVIYFYWVRGLEFWLFTLYDKNELSDLSKRDRATLESLLKTELKMRKSV